ncbi:MAG: ROK family protein, partial [Bacteroidota bacterium]
MNEVIVAGADIGGSHITVAIIDVNTGKIINSTRRRKEIDPNRHAEAIFQSWSAVIKESFKAINSKPSKIGIAMPGPFDYVNGISYIRGQNKYDALYGLNVKEQLAEKLEIAHGNITIFNDAACFLQGEVFGGAGKGFNRIIGLSLGTGLGSAWSIDGETEDADLWGSAYREGIAEDYFSTRWFLKRYKEVSGNDVSNVKELVGTAKEDGLVKKVFDEFGTNLAGFLIPYINAEQLQLVILGGNISLAFDFFSAALKAGLEQAGVCIETRPAALGEDAALLG